MPRQRSTTSSRQPGKAKTRWRARAVGLSSVAAAFLAFGMTPLATAPPARADGLEDLFIDPIIAAISQVDPGLSAAADLGDAGSFAAPAAAAFDDPIVDFDALLVASSNLF